ncbi:MAG: PorP/SprF family type IX secretion system membrane protein [Prolixibacteraceae bacterium]
MKKLISFFILFILVNLAAIAQQEPIFSNYMLMRHVTNPGFVGADKTINAIFNNRTMFAGFGPGKPVTSVFGVEAPVEIFGTRSGVGLVIVSDEVGYLTTVNIDASYAYHHTLETGTLGGGITLGLSNYSLAFGEGGAWFIPEDGDRFGTVDGDPTIPDLFSTNTFSVGAGVYYETAKYYIGLSASKLNAADVMDNEVLNTRVSSYVPTYYLSGSYNIELPDPLFDLRPSFLLRSDLAASMLDLNGTIYYKKKYWAGFGCKVTPRNFSAVTFLGGIQLMNGLNIGYAMDISTSMLFLVGATSHEVLVSYSFNLDTKRDQKYKSVRYL